MDPSSTNESIVDQQPQQHPTNAMEAIANSMDVAPAESEHQKFAADASDTTGNGSHALSGDAVMADVEKEVNDTAISEAANVATESAAGNNSSENAQDTSEAAAVNEENESIKDQSDEQIANEMVDKEQSNEAAASTPHDENKDMNNNEDANEETARDEDVNDEDDKEDDANPRRTKRRRSSATFSRYSPGEGGGLKRHRVDSDKPDVNQSSVVLKSDRGDSEPKVEAKKKQSKAKSKEPSNKQHYPIYAWVSSGTKSADRVNHTSLSIDFGPFAEDNTPLIDKDGSWKCIKCYHTNIPTKSRCGVCLSWKGGKRENYPRKGGDSNSGGGGGGASAPLVISVGDDVLISSGDTPWKDLNKMQERVEMLEKEGEEVSICYDDPVSSEPGLAVLDPYVARIEGMWEEIEEKTGGDAKKSLESRMMIQTRWYFKREDMEGLKLSMDGECDVQDRIAADMTVRDLILSDQIDLNSASCILGKASVSQLSIENKQKVKGGFVCRYKMNLDQEDETTGTLFPMVDSASESADSQAKETNRRGSDYTGASSEEETYPSRAEVFSPSAYGNPMSPRRVISEGPTVGKIKVGPGHQAVIPEQVRYCVLCNGV